MKRILINCDDLGMHETINRGIGRILSQKVIRSASIMPTAPAFHSACRLLHRLDIKRIGVHLALSAEYDANPLRPVRPVDEAATLCRPDGIFHKEISEVANQFDLEEVDRELRAQVRRVQEEGFHVSHLDGHMFFYHPDEGGDAIFSVVRNLAEELEVPFRCPVKLGGKLKFEMIWDEFDSLDERCDFYRNLLDDSAKAEYEVIIHPGEDLEEMSAFTKLGMRRYSDYVFFSAQAFADLVDERDIRVVTWDELR